MAQEREVHLGIAGLGPALRIGEGGNAVVYRCRQETLDRDVAVKVLKQASDEGTLRRFDREQRAMGRMSSHDGILTVYESGITPTGEPYLLMPLMPGSLQDEMDTRGAIPWAEAVVVIAEVADTLHHAHEAGLIHRDLKPANIMRGMSGRPLVADFGITRIVDAGASQQSTALTLTPAYSPPESLSGVEAAPTTDVYALGATLYALIEGHAPFLDSTTSTNLLALVRRIADDPVPPLTAQVPAWLDTVIAGAMAKEPADRISSAAELAARLRSGSAGGPGTAPGFGGHLAAGSTTQETSVIPPLPGSAPPPPPAAATTPPTAPAPAPAPAPPPGPASGSVPWPPAPAAPGGISSPPTGPPPGGISSPPTGPPPGGVSSPPTGPPPGGVSSPPTGPIPGGVSPAPAQSGRPVPWVIIGVAAVVVAVLIVAVIVLASGSDEPSDATAPPSTDSDATAPPPTDSEAPVDEPDAPTSEAQPGETVVAVAASGRLLVPSDFGMAHVAVADPVIGFADYPSVSDPAPYEPERALAAEVDFYVDETSTTNAFYREWLIYESDSEVYNDLIPLSWVIDSDTGLPEYPSGSKDNPVVGVSLDSARAYCAYVNKRLVTEIEWELAATRQMFVPDAVTVLNWTDAPEDYGPVAPGSVVLRGGSAVDAGDYYYRTIGPDDESLRAAAGIRCAADTVRPTKIVEAPVEAQTLYQDDFSDVAGGWPSTAPDGVFSMGYHPVEVFHIETQRPLTKVAVFAPDQAPATSSATTEVELRLPPDGLGQFRYGLIARASAQGYVVFTIRPEVEGDARYVNWCLALIREPAVLTSGRVAVRTDEPYETMCDGALGEGRVEVETFFNALSLSFDGPTPTALLDGVAVELPAGTAVDLPAGSVGLYAESFDESLPAHVHFDGLLVTDR